MTILAIDVGSSSVRALLFDHDASGVTLIPSATVQHPYEFFTGNDSVGTAIVNHDIVADIESVITKVLEHPAAQSINAVGMDTFVGNWTFIKNNPLSHSEIFTYADTRSHASVEALRQKIDMADHHQRTGTILHTAYYPAQLHWQGERIQQFDGICDLGTLIYRHWFKQEIPMSYSVAAWSGLLNRESLQWDNQWLDLLGLSESQFPTLADYNTPVSGLNDKLSNKWKQLVDVPFYLAVGDGASAQVGSGAVESGTATLTIGTTAAIRKVTTEKLPAVPKGCWSYRIDASHHLIGGALSEGGSVFAWARDTLKLDLESLENDLSNREPAQHGLTILPLLSGERSPNWRGDATGTIHGLRLGTTPVDIVHALLESIALRLAIVADQLQLGDDVILKASGGALANSPAWGQMIADAMQRPLHLLDEPEITALGTAHLAWCALNGQPVTGANPKVSRIIEPRAQFRNIMRELVEKQQSLYDKFYENAD